MSYSVGERYWVPHEDHAWLVGTLKEFKNSVLEFQTDKGILKFRVLDLKQKLEPCGSHIDDFVENLVDLDELSEGAILHHIRNRFQKKHIYTHVGSILVAVNPFESLDIYGERDIRRAQESNSLYPHVFVTAATAYKQLQDNRKNQSVLISGESGAGKTETTKKVLAYLANVAPDSKMKGTAAGAGEAGMETKILQSNPLLEALGNAKTLRNNNSSRFGKWMKVGFDRQFRIMGCEIINYLLEKSRVVSQNTNERNYHIFYQLLSGADSVMKDRLYLNHAKEYFYLNQSSCLSIENVDDAAEFKDTLQAMTTLQFSTSTIENIFRILSGILLLGNISFEKATSGDHSCISSTGQSILLKCADLFGVQIDLFSMSLIEKKVQMGRGSIVSIKLTESQAIDNRDTLSKTMYSNLFDYVIHRVNNTLRTEDANFSIGILDIFGFEVFDLNSFEQLCINYANEKLQSHFNEVIFSYEKIMYEEESIPLEAITFEDNNDCVNLLEGKPYGILALLEEECSLGNATDLTYISKLEKTFGNNKSHANRYFVKNKTKPDCFTVLHFAGGVEYNVTNFLDKNRDTLSQTLREVMECSQTALVSELFIEKNTEGSSPRKGAKTTLGMQFRNQLISLITSLKQTEPHFIRCIKPNHLKKPGILQGNLALCQLRYAGLFEAIRIRKSGFAYRVPYQSFASTYSILVPHLSKRRERKEVNEAQACAIILSQLTNEKKLPVESWRVGSKARVFLKNNSDRLILERERTSKIIIYVEKLQNTIRNFLIYQKSQKERLALKKEMLRQKEILKKQTNAIIIIQKHWRRYSVQKMMKSLTNLVALRHLLAKREVHKIKEVLARIDEDFQRVASGIGSNKGIMTRRQQEQQATIWKVFEHEVKVAKVMLRLLDIQDRLLEEIKQGIEKENVSELNRLLLKADRLELGQHPIITQARSVLLRLHRKRRIMKTLLRFLSNEDEYHEEIGETIEEGRVYGIDEEFLQKVQLIYNNAGPRLKTRNRLRQAIETCNGYAIEQGVLEVMAIREHHSGFAEAELRAARAMLRLLDFDRQLSPEKYFSTKNNNNNNTDDDNDEEEEEAVEMDREEKDHLHGGSEAKKKTKKKKEKVLLWGESLRWEDQSANPSILTLPLIEICDAITDATFPSIQRMHKNKLVEIAGSLNRVYEIIRFYKWAKILATWKYPEMTSQSNNPLLGGMNGRIKDDHGSRSESLYDSLLEGNEIHRVNVGGELSLSTATGANGRKMSDPGLQKLDKMLDSQEEIERVSFSPLLTTTNRSGGGGLKSSSMIAHSPLRTMESIAAIPLMTSPGVGVGGREDDEREQEEEFYGLRFEEARCNPYVIRSLHQDFDIFTSESKSASMEAALSSMELPSSFQETLANLDINQSIDKKIILPNGGVFQKTVTSRNRHETIRATKGEFGSPTHLSPSSPQMTYSPIQGTSRPKHAASALARTAQKFFVGHATAPREKIIRKAPLPTVEVRKVSQLDNQAVEKQLMQSRQKKLDEEKCQRRLSKDNLSTTRQWK